MAEIEFKRRGTPLWAVVLVLLVIAGALYALFGRKGGEPTPAPADSTTATAPTASATPAGGAAPAAPATPLGALAAWIDSAKAPSNAAEVGAYAGSGLQLLAAALQEKVPMAGVQYVLVRAMADTVLMAGTTPKKQLDATQAAFFATAYAMRDKPAGALVESAAQRVELTRPLAEQRDDVKRFFQVARDALRDLSKGPKTPAPAPKG